MKLTIKDALSILNLQSGATQEDIKIAYRKACSKFHPDRNPAGADMMKLVNVAYETLQNYNGETLEDGAVNVDFGDQMNDALNLIISLGLEIELCGTWLWVQGDTFTHREVLKENNFFWAPKKKMWYFRPADYKSKGRGKFTIDQIRARHGSQKINVTHRERIGA
jgi:hypothetical protein